MPRTHPDLGRHLPGARCRGDRGEVTSTVLVVPVLLFSVLVVIQFALAFHAQAVLTAAAQDAARAVQSEGGTEAVGETTAAQFVEGQASQLVGGIDVDVGADRDRVHVEVRGAVVSLVPGLHLSVSGTAEGPRERFRAEADR